jgi:putative NADH-flavin reductase
MTTTTKTVAVLYATKGGMGDVGKFAVTLAQLEPSLSCNVRPIAMSVEDSSEGTDKGLEVDVEDPALKEKIENLLATMSDTIVKIDIAKDSAEKEIGDALEGVDAVISCLGNRQPSMERWCALGTRKVVSAMKTKKIKRLVSLSSMGIGKDDFMRTTPLTVFWAALLRTLLRSARKDLYALEKVVVESDLDFVLVRPVGLTPSEPPQGSCDRLLSKPNKGGTSLKFMLSKSDAAAFMLEEALTPTIHSQEVTIGYSTSRSAAGAPTAF